MVRFSGCVMLFALLGVCDGAAATNRMHHDRQAAASSPQFFSLPAATSAIAGPETSIPFGWVQFCRDYAGECAGGPLPAVDVELNAATLKTIEKVNRFVNASVEPVSDMDHWGVVDQWDYPTDGKGDCEDYALLKRKMLIAAGLPRQGLLMTVVRDGQGEGHAILTIKSDHGDYVLDNLSDAVQPWESTGYRFVKRQSETDQNVWLTLRGPDVPAVSATQ